MRLFRLGVLLLVMGNAGALLWAQAHYPLIHHLDISDVVFRQLEDDVSQYYIDTQAGRTPPPLLFYAYVTTQDENVFDVAAQVNLPYDTIATLNGISSGRPLKPGTHLLIPNTPGIFVPGHPTTELEYLMISWRREASGPGKQVTVYRDERRERFFFYVGQRFHPVERAFFLGILFRFPLPKGVISSPYGPRIDPFTHLESFHPGIDIAAPYGTDVYAARGGLVKQIGDNREFGRYLLLQHAAGYQTFYGHLSKVLVVLNERVASGMIVAEVGSSGMSTGPHLHFEILRDGHPVDPLPLLPQGGG